MSHPLYLSVGEVNGDAIGCYLFGIEATPVSDITYHSVASSHEELLSDCKTFFENLAIKKEHIAATSVHKARHLQELKVIRNTIDNLPSFIAQHLASGMSEPFLKLGGIEIFLRTGMRRRDRFAGSYIE